ncbi:IS1595 family transposase [Paenibacillus frigoriresistens]|nr:IS1595 family transposase [Paenibacillus frigoriresistens]
METNFYLPSTLEQFHQQFPTEEACIDYFFSTKWPSGFSCPHCGHSHAYITSTRRLPLYECLQCHHQTSLTAGTIMAGSRTSLHKWLTSIFLISRTETGTNAVALSKIISVTYKTAWLILHKIRHAISTTDRGTLLSGIVQVNSAVYGKPYNPYFRNHPQEHYLLAGSSLDIQGDPSYFKLKLVLKIHIKEKLFQRSAALDFTQQHIESHTSSIEFVTGRFSSKRFRALIAFASLAGKSINNTFHGIGQKYLQHYLDEFCFKVNLTLREAPIFQHLTHLCAASIAKLSFFNPQNMPICA